MYKAIWRKLKNRKLLFSRNRELYVSKEVKENAFASEDKDCRFLSRVKCRESRVKSRVEGSLEGRGLKV